MKPKRPVREIPVFIESLDQGLADRAGFKHFRCTIGHGIPYVTREFAVDTSSTGGAETIRFKVKNVQHQKLDERKVIRLRRKP